MDTKKQNVRGRKNAMTNRLNLLIHATNVAMPLHVAVGVCKLQAS